MPYVTANEVEQYADDHGLEWPSDAGEQSTAINRATRYLNSLRWRGRRVGGRSQVNAWPRSGVTDAEGYDIPDNATPREILEAAKIFAIMEAADPGLLSPTITPNEIATSEKVGPISIQYRTRRDPEAARPIITAARDLLAPFLASRSSFALTRA